LGLEERLKVAVTRAYAAAGLALRDRDVDSLASTYAAWAENADDGVVDRVERALARSLGVVIA